MLEPKKLTYDQVIEEKIKMALAVIFEDMTHLEYKGPLEIQKNAALPEEQKSQEPTEEQKNIVYTVCKQTTKATALSIFKEHLYYALASFSATIQNCVNITKHISSNIVLKYNKAYNEEVNKLSKHQKDKLDACLQILRTQKSLPFDRETMDLTAIVAVKEVATKDILLTLKDQKSSVRAQYKKDYKECIDILHKLAKTKNNKLLEQSIELQEIAGTVDFEHYDLRHKLNQYRKKLDQSNTVFYHHAVSVSLKEMKEQNVISQRIINILQNPILYGDKTQQNPQVQRLEEVDQALNQILKASASFVNEILLTCDLSKSIIDNTVPTERAHKDFRVLLMHLINEELKENPNPDFAENVIYILLDSLPDTPSNTSHFLRPNLIQTIEEIQQFLKKGCLLPNHNELLNCMLIRGNQLKKAAQNTEYAEKLEAKMATLVKELASDQSQVALMKSQLAFTELQLQATKICTETEELLTSIIQKLHNTVLNLHPLTIQDKRACDIAMKCINLLHITIDIQSVMQVKDFYKAIKYIKNDHQDYIKEDIKKIIYPTDLEAPKEQKIQEDKAISFKVGNYWFSTKQTYTVINKDRQEEYKIVKAINPNTYVALNPNTLDEMQQVTKSQYLHAFDQSRRESWNGIKPCGKGFKLKINENNRLVAMTCHKYPANEGNIGQDSLKLYILEEEKNHEQIKHMKGEVELENYSAEDIIFTPLDSQELGKQTSEYI